MREPNLTSIPLLPAPTKICLIERRLLNLTGVSQISVAQELGSTVVREAGRLLNEFRCKSGLHVHVVSAGKPRAESEESYSLRLESGHALLDPGGPLGAIWGLATLRQLLQTGKSPSVEIIDAPAFKFRAVQIDLARQIERPERVCDLIDLYASHKFNILVLYLEGAYRYRNHPSVSRQFAWTYDKARRVVEHASSRGMKVIPVIPSLGHADYITRAKNYRALDESRDAARSGCLCPSQPRTYQVLSEMYSDWKDLATSGILHVGLDESWAIGKCPLCASRRAKNIGEGGIFVEHANRLAGLARSLGLRPAIWGDMFYYYPEALKNLRRDILIFDWYYYPFERFPKIEVFNFREIDSLALWAKHGLQAWGCAASIWDGAGIPSPRPFERLRNIRSWADYARKRDVEGLLFCQWELARLSIDFSLPIELAASEIMWSKRPRENRVLLGAAAQSLFGVPGKAFARGHEMLGSLSLRGRLQSWWTEAKEPGELRTFDDPEIYSRPLRALLRLKRSFDSFKVRAPRHGEILEGFGAGSSWLYYEWKKLETVNSILSRKMKDAHRALIRLQDLSSDLRLAQKEIRAQWNRSRYARDSSNLLSRLERDHAAIARDLKSLARGTFPAWVSKATLKLTLHVLRGGTPAFEARISADGENFKHLGGSWVILFDEARARPRARGSFEYFLPLDSLDEARFVEIVSKAIGCFGVSGIEVRSSAGLLRPQEVLRKSGLVHDAKNLLEARKMCSMGNFDGGRFFRKFIRDGKTGEAFSQITGRILLRMG